MRSWRNDERALVEDARRDGGMVRVTWHERERLFVISHWRDNVCVAASRVDVQDAGAVIGVLVDGLSSAVDHHPEPVPNPPSRVQRLLDQRAAEPPEASGGGTFGSALTNGLGIDLAGP